MRMDNWPLERIMRLPDWCFGRRFVISATASGVNGALAWDISELSFPEVCVVWSFTFWLRRDDFDIETFRVALGTQLPVAAAMMNALEPLIPGLGIQGAAPRQILMSSYGAATILTLRTPLETGGRNLVIEGTPSAAKSGSATGALVVSSMPREVPDWLISAKAINL